MATAQASTISRRAHRGEHHPGLKAAVGPKKVGPATSPHRAFESTPTAERARVQATDRLRITPCSRQIRLITAADRRGVPPGEPEQAQLIGCGSCACSSSAEPSSSAATSPPRRCAAATRSRSFTAAVHGAELFPEAEHVLGDRGGDLAALRGRAWDAAIDTSGYEPADVARSSALDLGHLVFVSTLQRLPRVAGRAGRRGQPGVDRGRRLRAAEGGLRARRARPPCPAASPACGRG